MGRTSEWRKRDGLYSGSEKSGMNSGGGQGLVRDQTRRTWECTY